MWKMILAVGALSTQAVASIMRRMKAVMSQMTLHHNNSNNSTAHINTSDKKEYTMVVAIPAIFEVRTREFGQIRYFVSSLRSFLFFSFLRRIRGVVR